MFLTTSSQNKDYDYGKITDTQITAWEDESRVHPISTRRFLRYRGVMAKSHLAAHLDAAESLIGAGHYDDACKELEAAADRLLQYKERVNDSLDNSIAHLSTLGSQVAAPHPAALQLVRLKRKLSA